MIWGIVLGLVIAGFIGLLSQVATFAMWNLYVACFLGAVVGGAVGYIWETIQRRREQAKAA